MVVNENRKQEKQNNENSENQNAMAKNNLKNYFLMLALAEKV